MKNDNDNTYKLFLEGYELYKKERYIEAEKILKQTFATKTHRKISGKILAWLYYKTGRFTSARKILNSLNNYDVKNHLLGLVDEAEYNFISAEDYYFELFSNEDDYYSTLFSLAKLYINLGKLDQAFKMFEKIIGMPNTCNRNNLRYQSYFEMINILILNHQYMEAYKMIELIDINYIPNGNVTSYKDIKFYLFYYLGILINEDYTSYYLDRLTSSNDIKLFNYIERHKDVESSLSGYVFIDSIDINELINIVRFKIKDLNPLYVPTVEKYRFNLDFPVGIKGKIKTNGIEVLTITGTRIILSMYPIELSKEFDREGFSTSKTLRLDRINGGIIL